MFIYAFNCISVKCVIQQYMFQQNLELIDLMILNEDTLLSGHTHFKMLLISKHLSMRVSFVNADFYLKVTC